MEELDSDEVKVIEQEDGRRIFYIDAKVPVDADKFIERLKEQFAKRQSNEGEVWVPPSET